MAGSMFTGQCCRLSIHVEPLSPKNFFVRSSTFCVRAYPYSNRSVFVGRPEMKRISTEAWVDFARGLLPPRTADQMNHHLEGCKKCRKAHDMWRAVAGAVSRERKYRPSETAVQRAKEMFALREVRGPVGRKARSRLIFDSFLQPLPRGVRNSMDATRQLQYRCGSLLIDIDLRKQSQAVESPVLLMGQILNADNPGERFKDFRVFLSQRKRLPAHTKSTPLGEFRFEFAGGKNWKLFFKIEGRPVIPVILPELTAAGKAIR